MLNKPKLFWLHPHFLYWMGGTKYIYEVINRLSSSFDLTVIVENTGDYAAKLYQSAGINLISLNKSSTTSLYYWLTFPLQQVDTLRRLNRLIPRGSLIVSSMFPMNYLASRLTWKHIQLCFEPFAFFHDPDFQKGFPLPKRFLLKILQLLYGQLDVKATKKSSVLITLNQVTAKTIMQIYGMRSTPVYTGIDSTHFHHHVSPTLKARYAGKEIIVHSTDYTPVKGTDRMIRIFAQVKKLEPQTHLLITSTIDNPLAVKTYQELAKSLGVSKSVEFLGFVDYDLLPQLYSLAKVLVQCSYSERSGTTSMALPVKEAMACGTPAIRSPITTEDVKDGVTGYLVDPRDEGEMVRKVIKLIKLSPDKYKILSREARKKIVKLYTWEKTAERIMSIINTHD